MPHDSPMLAAALQRRSLLWQQESHTPSMLAGAIYSRNALWKKKRDPDASLVVQERLNDKLRKLDEFISSAPDAAWEKLKNWLDERAKKAHSVDQEIGDSLAPVISVDSLMDVKLTME